MARSVPLLHRDDDTLVARERGVPALWRSGFPYPVVDMLNAAQPGAARERQAGDWGFAGRGSAAEGANGGADARVRQRAAVRRGGTVSEGGRLRSGAPVHCRVD